MTREQIEAWLIIEGWTPHEGQQGNARYIGKGPRGVWLNFDRGPACTAANWPNKAGTVAEYNIFSDSELQLIYQEIIKHEKD